MNGADWSADSTFHSPADAFKGFDQGQSHGVATMGLESEEEPRRGASRANSVRFDESANYGYYGQASRSSSELPLRTGSGLGSHPLTERSLSHRSDGRQSSSGQSHHSARTNSLGLETTSRLLSFAGSPLNPPPGLFLLGPVPCIIRCWLTTNFSNDTLLYAAVCSGSFTSTLGYPIIRKLGLEDLVVQEEDLQCVKLPLYLPEASVHQASSRSSSPTPQVPALTIRFIVREVDPDDLSIQIILGSDVLRSHNADVLFSQDKIIMVDDERNKISIPLVRPENDSVFKSLRTTAEPESKQAQAPAPNNNVHDHVGVIGQPSRQSTSAPASARTSVAGDHRPRSDISEPDTGDTKPPDPAPAPDFLPPGAGVWGSWRRETKLDPNAGKATRGRAMKVLRPTKSTSRVNSGAATPGSVIADPPDPDRVKPSTSNPIGGASAFGWLNPAQPTKRIVSNPPK